MPTAAASRSNSRSPSYVTTAIPYVNDVPHVGFALEMVQADALARFYRLSGDDVRFLAGTDENSLKNVHAAELAGIPVAALVERNAARFRALRESLELSFDDFIRTSTDARHRPGAERLWTACVESGDIYKRAYHGLYCTGCEQFYKPDELDDGRCPEHDTVPDEIDAHGEVEIVPHRAAMKSSHGLRAGLKTSVSRVAPRGRAAGAFPFPATR